MSQQRFSDIHRRALWEAHRKRCIYCLSPLLFKELFIDHVIPEKWKNDPPGLANLRISYHLPQQFNIEGDENLAPSCHSCNTDKLDRLLSPERIALILTRVEEKLPEVKRLRALYEDASGADKVIVQILTAVNAGKMSLEQLTSTIRDYEGGHGTFHLFKDLEFIEGAPISSIKRSDIGRLLDLPVKLGTELPEGLQLVKDGAERYVKTIREYRAAKLEGFYPSTNFALKMAGFFELPSAVLTSVENARPAIKSFIREPRIGVSDLRYLPSSLLPYLESQPEPDCKTLEDVRVKGRLTIRSSTSYSVEFEYSGMLRVLVEIMRADLDGDGIEEILVWSYERVLEGTHSFVSTMMLGRRALEAIFELVPL